LDFIISTDNKIVFFYIIFLYSFLKYVIQFSKGKEKKGRKFLLEIVD